MGSVIKVNDVSMMFNLSAEKIDSIKEYFIKAVRRELHFQEFWALRDISFTLEKGDSLGVIGLNGSGKSTLLKIVSGILKPTKGTVETCGSIAPLIELGAGFDANLSARENIYLNGAILGYSRSYMSARFDEIIEFAELQDFQERPFKQLSSGMKSRLAFSIACLVSPDILILDEVLSVGDGAFRKKSGDKMREILSSGVTGILVSHSLEQVRELCNKILWLDHGRQIYFGPETEMVCDAYEEFLISKNLPATTAQLHALSEAIQERRRREKSRLTSSEAQNLQCMLEAGSVDAAAEAALNFLRKYRPESLADAGNGAAALPEQGKPGPMMKQL